jgi:hypothetical protein
MSHRLQIHLESGPRTAHAYDVYVDMPQALSHKGAEAIISVFANNRDQAARIAHKAGWIVRSVNMVG